MLFSGKVAEYIGQTHGCGAVEDHGEDQQRSMEELGNVADDGGKDADTGQHIHKLAAFAYELIRKVAVNGEVDHYEHGQGHEEIVNIKGYETPEFSEKQFKEKEKSVLYGGVAFKVGSCFVFVRFK